MKKSKEDDQMTIDGTQEAEMLARLAERVERAVATIGELRKQRDDLRRRVEEVEGGLEQQGQERERLSELEADNERFRTEREQIRARIEGLLDKLEALEEPED